MSPDAKNWQALGLHLCRGLFVAVFPKNPSVGTKDFFSGRGPVPFLNLVASAGVPRGEVAPKVIHGFS